jgi:hypothetical protein
LLHLLIARLKSEGKLVENWIHFSVIPMNLAACVICKLAEIRADCDEIGLNIEGSVYCSANLRTENQVGVKAERKDNFLNGGKLAAHLSNNCFCFLFFLQLFVGDDCTASYELLPESSMDPTAVNQS